jgi:TrmH family RNA methyltransferase
VDQFPVRLRDASARLAVAFGAGGFPVTSSKLAITSRQHPIVKTFRRVARGDPYLALLDGWHLLIDAVGAGLTIETVALHGPPPDLAATRVLDRIDTEVLEVSESVMEALSPVRTPSGVVAIARRPLVAAASLFQPPPALVVVGIDVQDPGNLGALIRSAEAGGATGVVVTGDASDPWRWKALRAAMGSTFRLPVVHHRDVATALDSCRGAGLRIVASTPRGGTPIHDFDWEPPVAVLLGGEGPGLSEDTVSVADARVTIPMREPVESLNLAVAAALLVYEASRRRKAH